MADDLERQAQALRCELDTAVGLVADQAHLVQPLDHARRRGGRDPEPVGERVGRHRALAAPLERVDRLGVVLDGGGHLVGKRFGRHETDIMAQLNLSCGTNANPRPRSAARATR